MWGIVALQVRFICVDANHNFLHVQVIILSVVKVFVIMANVARRVQVTVRGVALNTISSLRFGLLDLLPGGPLCSIKHSFAFARLIQSFLF